MSILEELYNGNIAPFETIVPQDREYQLKNQEIIKLKEHFQGVLSTDNMEKFNHLNQLMQEVHYTDCLENFSYGFRLGIQLLLEALTKCDSIDD